MALASGIKIGPYVVSSLLGSGGMGEVYRARDTRLERDVAIKVLPPDASGNPDRRARFEREAKAIAALSHPNILAIFDTGLHDGQMYVVTELLPGETLRGSLDTGALPIRKAIEIAVQIARGLAAAHEREIVHRDLKPENVFILPDGQVKILDFGLARNISTSSGATLTAAEQTEPGAVMGTVGYMAPEQVRGLEVDARADLFALGVVLYEMLTGTRAFHAETATDTMFAIVKEEPRDLLALRSDAPPALALIVRHCLEKNPLERFHSARDVAFALEALSGSATSTISPVLPLPQKRGARAVLLAAVFVLIAGALTFAGWRLGRQGAPQGLPFWTTRDLTTDDGFSGDPALSPDGKLVAFVSDRAGGGTYDLWVRQVATGTPVRVTSGPFSVAGPAFSPDGSKVVFFSATYPPAIYVVSALGGEARRIADLPGGAVSPRFSPDGRWIAATALRDNRLVFILIPSAGGEPVTLDPKMGTTNGSSGDEDNYVWSPDSAGLLIFAGESGYMGGDRDLWFVPLEGQRTALQVSAQLKSAGLGPPLLVAWQGDWLYFRANWKTTRELWRLRLDPRSHRASEVEPVTSGWRDRNVTAIGGGGTSLVYADVSSSRDHIWSLPVSGKAGSEPGRMMPGDRSQSYPAPAGSNRLVYLAEESGQSDLWLRDLASGSERRITDTPESKGYPVVSRDGSRVAFRTATKNGLGVYVVSVDGGSPHKLCVNCGRVTDWSTDNKRVILHDFEGKQGVVGTIDIQSGEKRTLMQSDKRIYVPRLSADGRWIVFRAGVTGDNRSYVAPFREDRPISEGDWHPLELVLKADASYFQWAADGTRLYYLASQGDLYSVWTMPFDPIAGVRKGEPSLVFRPQGTHSLTGDQAKVGLSLVGDRVYFSMTDLHSNIGIAELDHPQ